MIYSTFDAGNFFVIPGSPAETWKTESLMALDKDSMRAKMGYGHEDVVITIVGSEFLYRGLWLEHSIVLRALLPLLQDFSLYNTSSHLNIIVLSGDSASNYNLAVEVQFRQPLLKLFVDKINLCYLIIWFFLGHCSSLEIPQWPCEACPD